MAAITRNYESVHDPYKEFNSRLHDAKSELRAARKHIRASAIHGDLALNQAKNTISMALSIFPQDAQARREHVMDIVKQAYEVHPILMSLRNGSPAKALSKVERTVKSLQSLLPPEEAKGPDALILAFRQPKQKTGSKQQSPKPA